jgi:hypothetical protein
MRYYRVTIITFLLVCLGIIPITSISKASAPYPIEGYGYQVSSISSTILSVRIHPEGPVFIGDQISIEILTPENTTLTLEELTEVQVLIDDPANTVLGPVQFGRDGRTGRLKAALQWAWDTHGLSPGRYTLTFTTSPYELTWSEDVYISDPIEKPQSEREAHWASVETECCIIHYITGTAAERDMELLRQLVEEEAQAVGEHFGVELQDKATITFLPRVLGHGGFAGEELYVSYLDRHYAGSGARQVIHHEIVHMVDGQLGGEFRPSIFVEGLAVYLTGGHFKPEPISLRARALLDLNWYIPLQELTNDFYVSQHEIGYLQGAALVEYIINTWGFEAFSNFYRDIKAPQDGNQAAVIDTALQEHFSLTYVQLEERFIEYLNGIPLLDDQRDDLRLTVHYYDTVRRYQRLIVPSAYFLDAWLPSGTTMRERGIVADFLRQPNHPENIVIEMLLVAADQALRLGDYDQVEDLLLRTNQLLDQYVISSPLISIIRSPQIGLLVTTTLTREQVR